MSPSILFNYFSLYSPALSISTATQDTVYFHTAITDFICRTEVRLESLLYPVLWQLAGRLRISSLVLSGCRIH